MRFLYFLHPEQKTYYKISCRDKRLPKISLWELNKVSQYLREKNIKEYNEEELIKAIKQLHQIEKQAIEKSKEVRRRKSSKIHHQEKQKLEEKYLNTSEIEKEEEQIHKEPAKESPFDVKDDEIFEID